MPELRIHTEGSITNAHVDTVPTWVAALRDSGFNVSKSQMEKAKSQTNRWGGVLRVPFGLRRNATITIEDLRALALSVSMSMPDSKIHEAFLCLKAPVTDFPNRELFRDANPRNAEIDLLSPGMEMEFQVSTQFVTDAIDGIMISRASCGRYNSGTQQARRYLAARAGVPETSFGICEILGLHQDFADKYDNIRKDTQQTPVDIREFALPDLYLMKGSLEGMIAATHTELKFNTQNRGQYLLDVTTPLLG